MSRFFDPYDPVTLFAAVKVASRLSGALGGAGALMGAGLGAGALLGAGSGGVSAYRDAKAQGATGADAVGAGLGGAVNGLLPGALGGAALGAVGGGAAGALRPGAMESVRRAVTKAPGVGAFARFGQRQVHGLTGHTPSGGLAEIRHGAEPRWKGVEGAVERLEAAHRGESTPGLVSRLRGRTAVEEAEKGLRSANRAYNAGAEAEAKGLTSLPGYVRAVRRDGVLPTLQTAARDQFHGMSPGMKALTLSAPALDIAAAAGPQEEGGPSRSERIGRAVGSVASTALSPLPQGTQMLLQGGLSTGLGHLGRAIGNHAAPTGP